MTKPADWGAWKLAALIGVAILLGGSAILLTDPNYWGRVDVPLQRMIFIDQSVMGAALLVAFGKEPRGSLRTPGTVFTVGLLGATLFGTGGIETADALHKFGIPEPSGAVIDLAIFADPLAFCMALAIVVLLARAKRWKLMWLGIAAMWGGLMLMIRLVGLGMSFM